METGLLESTHNIIVETIRDDFSVDSLTIGEFTDSITEEDPLGQAFYTFAILETGYVNIALESLPQTWGFWVEEKLSGDELGVHTDTELAALGLILFALLKHHKLEYVPFDFSELVKKHFDNNKGIYSNFMATVLVGLGLSQTNYTSDIFEKIKTYISKELEHSRKIIFNDPKNFVVAYWWCKRISNPVMCELIRIECLSRVKNDKVLNRDRVYFAYILMEEQKSLLKEDLKLVQTFIENSLMFIRDYTLESKNPTYLIDEYGERFEINSSVSKSKSPKLSRIILSVGHLVERNFSSNNTIFDSTEKQQGLRFRIAMYAMLTGMIGFFIFYFGQTSANFPLKAKNFWQEENIDLVKKFPIIFLNAIWLTLCLYLLIVMVMLIRRLFDKGISNDLTVLKHSFSQSWKIIGGVSALLALLLSALITT